MTKTSLPPGTIALDFARTPNNLPNILRSLLAGRPTQATADKLGVRFHAAWTQAHARPELVRSYVALCNDANPAASICTPAAPAPFYTFALPPLYLHAMAMPLHMAILSHPAFPLRLMGLVHVSNRVEVLRPIAPTETLTFVCDMPGIRETERGQSFEFQTRVEIAGETVWREVSGFTSPLPPSQRRRSARNREDAGTEWSAPLAQWRVAADAGRRFARPSGDFNPIHLHPVLARMLGFKQAIAHGMFSAARCLHILQGQAPSAGLCFDVEFKRPLPIPSQVQLVTREEDGVRHFLLRGKKSGEPHLIGSLRQKA